MGIKKRIFDYKYKLLPNNFLAKLESKTNNIEDAMKYTGLSPGYPTWNFLYYSILCSLPKNEEVSIVETGTNRGASTIILAQALKDLNINGRVHTIDIDSEVVKIAKKNLSKAGLINYVKFHVGDSRDILPTLTNENITFAFLDSEHDELLIKKEFDLIYPFIKKNKGTIIFDNASEGGEAAKALKYIMKQYGGNLIKFDNCSWSPPGIAIWQDN
ncbi:MAG: class I SAM-dependent methyltransferase [Candidatus Pacearchaeota archaeon]|nr:class I SAM-dependent methyltransferase [Candidatus Pacearchaeota archaeon]